MIPVIEFSASERSNQLADPETVSRAATALRSQGCVLLRDVFSPEFVGALREAHLARNASFLRAEQPAGTGKVGNRRFMGPVELSPPFNDPLLYANPLALPVLKAVLGPELVLGACGTVTSLPGAADQHMHRDGPPLFNKAINRISPAHAVNFFVPLVEFNESTGTTRFFPGTHLNLDADPQTTPYADPVVPVGSCVLMDYRLLHQGRANRSDLVRPLLYAVYHQSWFKDYRNHSGTAFLRLSDAEYAKIPAEHRSLFSWIEHYKAGLY